MYMYMYLLFAIAIWSTVLLGLIPQWLNPLREFLAPSFSPQLESAAPLLALQVLALQVLLVPPTSTIRYRYTFSPQWESVGPLSLKHRGPQWESIV